jgi:threonine dehydratase
MPVTTPDIKIDAVRRLGGVVELVGESYSETQAHAQARALHASICVLERTHCAAHRTG